MSLQFKHPKTPKKFHSKPKKKFLLPQKRAKTTSSIVTCSFSPSFR